MGSNDLQVVPGQDWKRLPVPQLGAWTPRLSVCVVLPARDCQDELDRTLAALAQQSYPEALLEVVVVDDASTPPLRLPRRRPARSTLVRLDDPQSHGSGRARHAGSTHTDADVLLFLDADMVAERTHVEAHARWHHLSPHAVVLGRKWFVDFTEVTAEDVATSAAGDGMAALLQGRRWGRHAWQEDLISGQQDLTQETDDAFLAVVGASVSLRADFYQRTGGFSAFGLRGIVDTEFGYRAFTSGALLVPDKDAVAYHQGERNFSSRGDEIKRQRTGLAANYLPIPMFRLARTGRRWAVPMASVVVQTQSADPEQVQFTVDSVLASDFTDLAVTVLAGAGAAPPQWLLDYFGHDGRVEFTDQPKLSGFPSPLSVAVSAGLVLEADTLTRCAALLMEQRVGVVRTHPRELGGRGLEVWRTRAILRASGGTGSTSSDIEESVCDLFGERWVRAAGIGVHAGRLHVSKQGMLIGEPEVGPT